MKLLSSYKKEMKIAARGFYFYIEIFMAALLLIILLVAVKEESVSKDYEFLFYDMDQAWVDVIFEDDIEEGIMEYVEDTVFEVKEASFELTDTSTGEVKSYDFDAGTVTAKTIKAYERDTGKFDKTLYLMDSEEEMLWMAYTEKKIGARMSVDESDYTFYYDYIMQGYETERFTNVLYILHNESPDAVREMVDTQTIRSLDQVDILNNRENMVPLMVVFMGSLMGFFIVMAYIFLDKDEGVIKAFAVTPSRVWQYLLSKTMIILTTVIVSSSIITIPVMGLQPNYPLFYLYLIITTFAFAALGLLIASYFDNIVQSFGILYFTMIALLIPAFSYFVPSFDPVWLRYFPTYPMLQGFKEIMMTTTDVDYVLTYCGIFAVAGLVLFMLANYRFKKTLTV
jgi:ABC-2 type transport system permease protein